MALLLVLVAAAPAASAMRLVPTHGGRSYAVRLSGMKVLGTASLGDTILPDDVNLPPAGGFEQGAVGTITLPANLGSMVVARADVQGDGEKSRARSEVTSVTVLPGGPASGVQLPGTPPGGAALLEAHLLTAGAAVTCAGAMSAGSSIANLSVLGRQIDVGAGRDSVILVRLGGRLAARVWVNARQTQVAGGRALGSVSALRVEFPADGPLAAVLQGTITLSHADASMRGCTANPAPIPATGGGSSGCLGSTTPPTGISGPTVIPIPAPVPIPVPDSAPTSSPGGAACPLSVRASCGSGGASGLGGGATASPINSPCPINGVDPGFSGDIEFELTIGGDPVSTRDSGPGSTGASSPGLTVHSGSRPTGRGGLPGDRGSR